MEVGTLWTSATTQQPSAVDPTDGRRESDLGRRTHCQRIEAETRLTRITSYRRKYMQSGHPVRTPDPKQRWLTFIHKHAQVIAACDFFVVVTATFRMLYVFVVMELGTRRILHHNVTAHPTAEWTLQQFREAFPGDHAYRFPIHDRDSIFSKEVDKERTAMGVQVLRTPVQAPKANSLCERFGGTLRRECLDFLIPFNERHLKFVLNSWIGYFNHARPHMSLGPGIPVALSPHAWESTHRHRTPAGHVVRRVAILGGLHHEYWLEKSGGLSA